MNKLTLERANITRIMILMASAVILVSLVFIFITSRDIHQISQDIREQEIQLEEQYQQGRTLRAYSEQLREIKPQIKIVEQAFISSTVTLDFINDLEKTAELQRVEQVIQFPEIEAHGNVFTVPVELELNGTIENILNYLTILDRKPYYLNIEEIELQIPQSPTSLISLSLVATSFWK